jgi:hypothetical protein
LLIIDVKGIEAGPIPKLNTGEDSYELVLRRGLGSNCNTDNEQPEETFAHLIALIVHLRNTDRAEEAHSLAEEGGRVSGFLRNRAREAFIRGEYVQAERALRSLISVGFEIPGSRCHLARALMMQDRFEAARIEATAAWEQRQEAAAYVVPRVLWIRLALLWASSQADGPAREAENLIGWLKSALRAECVHMEWTIQPVLDHIAPHLMPESLELLRALSNAIDRPEALAALDSFPAWTTAAPLALW